MKKCKYIILLISVLLSVNVFDAATIRMEVVKPRGKANISVGDAFWIKIITSDITESPAVPRSVKGAKVLYFENTGHQFSQTVINGRSRQSSGSEWVLTLRASQEGTFKFGPVSIGGVKSNVVSYSIDRKGSSKSVASEEDNKSTSTQGPKFIGKGDNQLFLRASVSKNTAYEQEALTYTVKLYTTYDGIRFIGASAAPTFDGFTVEETKNISNQYVFETYNGKTYATTVIARYVIFPQMSGNLKVHGNTYTVSVNAAEYYSDPYFSNITVHRPIQLNVTPNDLVVNVKNLPSPKPADFSGGVGEFAIDVSLPSKNIATNQAANIIYTVSGFGNLKYLKMPNLNMIYPKQIDLFDPTSDVKCDIANGTLKGSVSFDYSIMPLEQGKIKIPEVKFVYFNPETEKYETATARGFSVDIAKGIASDKSQTGLRLKFDDKLQKAGKLSREFTPLIFSILYWLLYIIPSVVVVIILYLYRRRLKELGNLDLLKSKKAGSVARKRLKKAAIHLKNNDSNNFYDEMLVAIWGFLSDRLHISQSELNRNNVKQNLMRVGCDQSISDRMINLLDECEYAKYASGEAIGNMQYLYEEATELINLLASTINVK